MVVLWWDARLHWLPKLVSASHTQSGGVSPNTAPRSSQVSPLPRVPRFDSQHQTAARADTFVLSAQAASHLKTTVSRGPVAAHAVAKSARVLLYPREPPVPQVFEAPASGAVLGVGVLLPCCRPSGFRSLSPCRSAPIPSLRALSSRPRAAPTRGLGSGRGPRSQRVASVSSSGSRERSATHLPQSARESTPGKSCTLSPRGPLRSPGPGRSPCSQRSPAAHVASLPQPLHFVAQGPGAARRIARPPLYILKELLAPQAPRYKAQGSSFQRGLRGRRAVSPPWGAEGPLSALSVHQASPASFRVSGEWDAPRSPLIESDYPNAVRSSRSSRPPCLAAWPRPEISPVIVGF
ncbi:hypothetical protein NDU88_006504 [Pleurodeles waltl]|uniref:Uncharacterized protein n=1 Tax=Pleurodeles waltl TaxID=8319 RepID=A0AAV7TFA9_PLEWA|nr:hypothetical protein NDU88_006504 [Pleurodeles waltl]